MKKLKNEKALLKKALATGMRYAEKRGVARFDATDSANDKIEYVYRLLVHDRLINPLPDDQLSLASMRHRLVMWASHLP